MRAYDQLRPYMEKAMAIKTALTLFEWDNETLAPDEAGELTASVIGVLSGEYLEAAAGKDVERLLAQCEEEDREDGSLGRSFRECGIFPRRSIRNLPGLRPDPPLSG